MFFCLITGNKKTQGLRDYPRYIFYIYLHVDKLYNLIIHMLINELYVPVNLVGILIA